MPYYDLIEEFNHGRIAFRLSDIDNFAPELWTKLKNKHGLMLGNYAGAEEKEHYTYVCMENGYFSLYNDCSLKPLNVEVYNFTSNFAIEEVDESIVDEILRGV